MGELTKMKETAIDEGIFIEIEIGVRDGKVVISYQLPSFRRT